MVQKNAQKRTVKPPGSKSSQQTKSSKSAPPTSKEAPAAEPKSEATLEELGRQQILLNIFNDTFKNVLSSESFNNVLQEVKQALYNREFAKAFGRADYLDVYAARWSPTRTLGYVRILDGISGHLESLCLPVRAQKPVEDAGTAIEESLGADGAEASTDDEQRRTLKMLSIGGGAAEIVALASFLRISSSLSGDITLLDTGPWGDIVTRLQENLVKAPELSKYASAAAKAANQALVSSSRLNTTFAKQDILGFKQEQLAAHLGSDALLVTLLFTLNELYTTGGMGQTTAFLRTLTACIPIGSLLLVVDSPGSYSEAAVGKEARKYPMQWLLDHTLLGGEGEEPADGCKWEKLESQDSAWFRIAEELRYPIPLENMRYQMHLYRALARNVD